MKLFKRINKVNREKHNKEYKKFRNLEISLQFWSIPMYYHLKYNGKKENLNKSQKEILNNLLSFEFDEEQYYLNLKGHYFFPCYQASLVALKNLNATKKSVNRRGMMIYGFVGWQLLIFVDGILKSIKTDKFNIKDIHMNIYSGNVFIKDINTIFFNLREEKLFKINEKEKKEFIIDFDLKNNKIDPRTLNHLKKNNWTKLEYSCYSKKEIWNNFYIILLKILSFRQDCLLTIYADDTLINKFNPFVLDIRLDNINLKFI